ncbi:class I SAM-dependent methyltransferase [Massilia sp. CF038]|uniref:class I SAM-dependent methyltransferase n=1 Tax=Massilia sp. CF038 TaxID=1881045 RepID=UPI00091EB5B8|nr:class I SAM-dependent methyltransferase [Massilia sp. CF038]SHG55570.1 transcriptional regulator, MerR family [Massilia sp. CF038]
MKENKPSNTALIVAAGLQLATDTRALTHLMPAEAQQRGAALLRKAYPGLARLLQKRWFRRLALWAERTTLPGISLHFALRKRRLRQLAQQAVEGGCRQVVVLGAGFDTLCAELLAVHPHLRCFEIDHPATQLKKRAAVGPQGAAIVYLGVDLAQQPLASVLAQCPPFESNVPTLFVAEGLLMYVPLDAVAGLFRQMAAAAPDCCAAFTWLAPQADGRPNFTRPSRLIDFWLKLRGEPFMSAMERAKLPDFVAANGFALRSINDSIDLLSPAELGQLDGAAVPMVGEYICFATTTESTQRD